MNWLLRLLRRDRLERELDDELRFHVDQLVTDYTSSGLCEAEARRRALREFGLVELVKDECRRVRRTEWLTDFVADVRVGLRMFAKERAFSLVAVTALAAGLGVNAIFFSLVNTFCLSGLPYPGAAELVDISVRDDTGRSRPFSLAQIRALADVALIDRVGYYVTRDGAVRTSASVARRSTVAYVSDHVLSLIGETPSQGRPFRPEEYGDPYRRTAILSAALSNELFGNATAAVGQDILLDGVPTNVVGVLPAIGRFPDNADVWEPISSLGLAHDALELTMFARLKTATARDSAGPMVEAALRQSGLLGSDRQHVAAVPLNDRYRGRASDPVWIAFMTAGALVVLIACSNVSNLLLARGVRRTPELATRLSLGASRSRIFRQLLTETLVLVMAACVGAVFVSWGGLHALRAAIPQGALPYWTRIELDWRTIAVLFGVGLMTVLVSGTAPALHLARVPRMAFNARTASDNRTMAKWSSGFLVLQLSLSVLLLSAMGITVQVYQSLANSEQQARLADILSAEISLPPQRYSTSEARGNFLKSLRRGLSESGQVLSVSVGEGLPGGRGEPRSVTGGSIAGSGAFVSTIAIDAEYFATLGLPLLSGREFTSHEIDAGAPVAVVNDRFARLFFGEVSVVGQRFRFTSESGAPAVRDSCRILGVVRSFRGEGALNAPPIVYVPGRPGISARSTILMRGVVKPLELAPVLQKAVVQIDPDVPLADVLSLQDAVWRTRWPARVSQALITAVASVGFCLALFGVAALTAHRVAARSKELSIRVALGATPAQLMRTVLRPVMLQLLLGLAVGTLLAKGWQRGFGSPIAASDNLALVAVLVSAPTLLFSAWPARRAAHADPVTALRSDG